MTQWVVTETVNYEITGVYGPFDHKGLADAFAVAYGLARPHVLVEVHELNKDLK